MYISTNLSWRLTGLWCVVMAFGGMGYMLAFFQNYMRTEKIQELIQKETLRIIHDFSEDGKNVTHSEIDRLPVVDMLEHIDYKKEDETKILIDTLAGIMRKGHEEIKNTSLNNTLLVTWVKHVIGHMDIEDEYEKERMLYFLSGLWKEITAEGSESENCSYSLQILIPFMDAGAEDAPDMLIRLWKIMNLYSHISLIYLLLYAEFRFRFIDGKVHECLKMPDQNLRYELNKIKNGAFIWDRNAAWQYWLDWSQYNRQRGDIGMKHFDDFCKSVEALKSGERGRIRSLVLISI